MRLKTIIILSIGSFLSTANATNITNYNFDLKKLALSSPAIKKSLSSNILDLSALLDNDNLSFAVRNPKTNEITYTKIPYFIKKGQFYYESGNRLQGYAISSDITSGTCALVDLQIPEEHIKGKPTSEFTIELNLSSRSLSPNMPFDPKNPASYNNITSSIVYDAEGNTHTIALYFALDYYYPSWNVYVLFDDSLVTQGELSFSPDGTYLGNYQLDNIEYEQEGKNPQMIHMDWTRVTQFASPFVLNAFFQNGYVSGDLVTDYVSRNGYISVTYDNGVTETFGKLAVFADNNLNK